MSTGDLLSILVRRWYVVIAVLAIVGCCGVALARESGAYTVDTTVQFVAPDSEAIGPDNEWQQETMVNFAAVVEDAFHGWQEADRVAESASLFGAGVDRGYQVLLQNMGGQWEQSYPNPTLSIKVVGPTESWVRDTTEEIVNRVDSIVERLQSTRGVDREQEITVERVPAEPVVAHAGRTGATTARAMVIFAVIGFALAAVAATLVDGGNRRFPPQRRTQAKDSLLPRREGTA